MLAKNKATKEEMNLGQCPACDRPLDCGTWALWDGREEGEEGEPIPMFSLSCRFCGYCVIDREYKREDWAFRAFSDREKKHIIERVNKERDYQDAAVKALMNAKSLVKRGGK